MDNNELFNLDVSQENYKNNMSAEDKRDVNSLKNLDI